MSFDELVRSMVMGIEEDEKQGRSKGGRKPPVFKKLLNDTQSNQFLGLLEKALLG